MNTEYTSDVIKKLKENGNEYTWGNVTVKLAEGYGFCLGVEMAVQIAYEARKQFPTEKIWITNEIIHNPTVNKLFEFDYKDPSFAGFHSVSRQNEIARARIIGNFSVDGGNGMKRINASNGLNLKACLEERLVQKTRAIAPLYPQNVGNDSDARLQESRIAKLVNGHEAFERGAPLSFPDNPSTQKLMVVVHGHVDVDEVLGSFVVALNIFIVDRYSLNYSVSEYHVYEFFRIKKLYLVAYRSVYDDDRSSFMRHHFYSEAFICNRYGSVLMMKLISGFMSSSRLLTLSLGFSLSRVLEVFSINYLGLLTLRSNSQISSSSNECERT